jgi:hypothetical protein
MPHLPKTVQFGEKLLFVLWEFDAQVFDLNVDREAKTCKDAQEKRHDDHHGRDTANAVLLQPFDEWAQDERQQDGHGYGNQDFPSKIQGDNNQGKAGADDQGALPGF